MKKLICACATILFSWTSWAQVPVQGNIEGIKQLTSYLGVNRVGDIDPEIRSLLATRPPMEQVNAIGQEDVRSVVALVARSNDAVYQSCTAVMVSLRFAVTAKHCIRTFADVRAVVFDDHWPSRDWDNIAYVARVYDDCKVSDWCVQNNANLTVPIPENSFDDILAFRANDLVVLELNYGRRDFLFAPYASSLMDQFSSESPTEHIPRGAEVEFIGFPDQYSGQIKLRTKCNYITERDGVIFTNCRPYSGGSGGALTYTVNGVTHLLGILSGHTPPVDMGGGEVLMASIFTRLSESQILSETVYGSHPVEAPQPEPQVQ